MGDADAKLEYRFKNWIRSENSPDKDIFPAHNTIVPVGLYDFMMFV